MKKCIYFLFMLFCFLGHAEDPGWKTNLGLSYVSTSGNTSTQTFSGKLESSGDFNSIRTQIKAGYLITKDDKTEKANKLNIDGRLEKPVTAGLFAFLEAAYMQDKFSGYDYRISVGPGLGYDFINCEKHQLKGLASCMIFSDKYSVGPVSKDAYGTAKTGLNYTWAIRENVTFVSTASYLTSLEDSDKSFINGEAAFHVAINSRLAIGLSAQVNHQNSVPSPEIKKTDTMFMTSLLINL